jgi:oxygen-independent coproporphyrinogen-3 oxidase
VQSFHSPSRRALNRSGLEPGSTKLSSTKLSSAESCSAESWLEYFSGALSADLISGLPFQNEKILINDINTVLSYRPAHISLYALTLEPDTPLAAKNTARNFLPPADEADRLWLCGRDALEKASYAQYEVSNFCLDGKESLHNIRYWRMLSWLALGPAASGTIINDETGTGIRYANLPDVDQWIRDQGSGTKEELDSLILMKETFLMGFRYIEGPDEELFQRRFRCGIGDCIPKTLERWRKRGLLQNKKNALTKEGLLFLDHFLAETFLELETCAVRDAK